MQGIKSAQDSAETSTLTDDERALRLLLQITMGVDSDPLDVEHTLSSLNTALSHQKKLESTKSLLKPLDDGASQPSTRRGSFRLSRRGSISGSWRRSRRGSVNEHTFGDESVFGSETSEADDDPKIASPQQLEAAVRGLLATSSGDGQHKKKFWTRSRRGSLSARGALSADASYEGSEDDTSQSSSIQESDGEESEELTFTPTPVPHESVPAKGQYVAPPITRSRAGSINPLARLMPTKHFSEGDISRTASPARRRKQYKTRSTSTLGDSAESSTNQTDSQQDPRVTKLIQDIKRANTTITELNSDTLAKIILIMALVNPKMDDAHNYKIRSYQGAHGMVRELIRVGNGNHFFDPTDNKKCQTHSILFCLDVMTQPISEDTTALFLQINQLILVHWTRLIKQHQLQTSLSLQSIEYIKLNCLRIQNVMRTKQNVTLMDCLDDNIRPYYQEVFEYKYAHDRFSHLHRSKKVDKKNHATTPIDPTQLEKKLLAIESDWQKLDNVVANLKIGRHESFKELSVDKCKEEALRRLDFSNMNHMGTDAVYYILTEQLFKPRVVNLANWKISSKKIYHILEKNGEQIVHLDLSGCIHVTDDLFKVLEKYCPNLQTLVLAGTHVSTLNANLPKLATLDLSHCQRLDKDIIKQIGKHCENCRVLKLNHTHVKEIKITRMNLTRLEVSDCSELRSIYTYTNAVDKKTGANTPKSRRSSVSGSPVASRKKNKATKARQLAYIVANNNPHLKRLLIEDESFPNNLSATGNPQLREVFVKNGDKVNSLHFEGCTQLEMLRIAPNVLSHLNVKGCHNMRKAPPERLETYLLDAIIATKFDMGDPELAASSYTILLRTKENFFEWAVKTSQLPFFDKWIIHEQAAGLSAGESRAENIFNDIQIPGFNASFCTVRGEHFAADLSYGIAHQTDFSEADLEDATLTGIHFGQKTPFHEHGKNVLNAVAYNQKTDQVASSHHVGRGTHDSVVVRKPDQTILKLPHDGSVTTVNFTPDGRFLATAGCLFDESLSRRNNHYEDRVHPEITVDLPRGAKGSENCFAFASSNQSYVNIWSLDETSAQALDNSTLPPRLVHSFYTHSDEIIQIAFSPCGEQIAATDGSCLRVRNWRTGKPLAEYKHDDQDGIYCFAFHPDPKKQVLATGGSKNIVIWDTKTGKKIKTIAAHDSGLKLLHFSEHGNLLLSSSDDKTIKVWEFHTWKPTTDQAFDKHNHQVLAAQFLPGSLFIASADDTGQYKNQLLIWDARTNEVIHQCDLPSSISAIATKQLTTGEQRSWEVLTACYDGLVYRWVVTDEKIATPIDTQKVHQLRFKKDPANRNDAQAICNIEGAQGISDDNLALLQALGSQGNPAQSHDGDSDEQNHSNDPTHSEEQTDASSAVIGMEQAAKFTLLHRPQTNHDTSSGDDRQQAASSSPPGRSYEGK